MNTSTSTEFDFSFLEEGFSARDIVEQKINESSTTVSILCRHCLVDKQNSPAGLADEYKQDAPVILYQCSGYRYSIE